MSTEERQRLWDAAASGNRDECRRLLEAGVPVDAANEWNFETALAVAARRGFEDIVALLLEKGARINGADNEGNTAISGAVLNGQTAMVAFLLDNGARPDTSNRFCWTALLLAADEGLADVVALLLEHGASVAQTGKYDDTPLVWAAGQCHTTCLQVLLAATLPSGIAPEMRAHFV